MVDSENPTRLCSTLTHCANIYTEQEIGYIVNSVLIFTLSDIVVFPLLL